MVNYLTKIGLNDVPEELLTDETNEDGLDQNDIKIETSEIIENDKNSSLLHTNTILYYLVLNDSYMTPQEIE